MEKIPSGMMGYGSSAQAALRFGCGPLKAQAANALAALRGA